MIRILIKYRVKLFSSFCEAKQIGFTSLTDGLAGEIRTVVGLPTTHVNDGYGAGEPHDYCHKHNRSTVGIVNHSVIGEQLSIRVTDRQKTVVFHAAD